ncbi:MAG: aldehyde ferredoxin oxidoreductase C-terminal domain-containing protein [Desulfosudis oleivorans]|nr:aldehyde ferredoxin oxidoreductase C-terminal domain-containing protein [Desulfosudis oleivorans]
MFSKWVHGSTLTEIPEIFSCVELCNRLGMDVISTSSVVAFILELFEKGMHQRI